MRDSDRWSDLPIVTWLLRGRLMGTQVHLFPRLPRLHCPKSPLGGTVWGENEMMEWKPSVNSYGLYKCQASQSITEPSCSSKPRFNEQHYYYWLAPSTLPFNRFKNWDSKQQNKANEQKITGGVFTPSLKVTSFEKKEPKKGVSGHSSE